MNYIGTIIEESLVDKTLFKNIKILNTKVERVNSKHKTPWLNQWTLHKVEIDENKALEVAEAISQKLDYTHRTSWYADYKNELTHYIVFKDKIFKINRKSKEQYNEAKNYGLSLGIPEYQVDFHPDVKDWKR